MATSIRSTAPYTYSVNTLQQDIEKLANFFVDHPRLVVLTGAGISAPSGIPTYRDRHGAWQHRSPIQEQAFLIDEQTRRRYWARSWYGWPLIRDALPNPAHHALASLEAQGRIELLITQNVDSLHQRAGSRNVLDLHGAVGRVRCLTCGAIHCRESIQEQLAGDNVWPTPAGHQPRPDGDMETPDALLDHLVLPLCPLCGGDLKPDVVFFGGSVPRENVASCHEALARADALLAIGSSLMVFSGFRFCRLAAELGKPVALINPGVTRADALACFKLSSLAGPLLTGTLNYLHKDTMRRPSAPGSPS
ncbi:NAD-dependent protein deacetylase [Halioglobus japonicus]|nr:NAD-dependent protein deacetylase [Halioglobus japonicus]